MKSDWSDFEKYMMQEIKELRRDVSTIRSQLSAFKVKVAVIGSTVSLIVSGIVTYITKHL